jgi:ribosomal protein S18 acetylase RimI-like enzyme
MKIIIEQATEEFRGQIEDWHLQTMMEHHLKMPSKFPKDYEITYFRNKFKDAFSEIKSNKGLTSAVWIAKLNGQLVGYIAVCSDEEIIELSDVHKLLFDVYVEPSNRNQGVASELLKHVLAISDSEKWDNVKAVVWANNDSSIKLFENLGFTTHSRVFCFGPNKQPAIKRQNAKIKHSWINFVKLAFLLVIFAFFLNYFK